MCVCVREREGERERERERVTVDFVAARVLTWEKRVDQGKG